MACEIRAITPPRLGDAHLGERIICHRPLRYGSPNFNVERRGQQIIVHHYGHGGSGWALAPASVHYVNQLLFNSPDTSSLKKNSPITIIGAGIIGLLTAYDLIQKGFTQISLVAEHFEALTSHNAGGLWCLISMHNDLGAQKLVDQLGAEAYQFYRTICNNAQPDFMGCAQFMPAYFPSHDNALEPYVGRVLQPGKDVILDFGQGTTRAMVAYDDCIFIDTPLMMATLYDYLKSKINFIRQKIIDFKEIEQPFIINCTGLGARHLNNDPNMVSVQGHLILLKNQNPADLQYMMTYDQYTIVDPKIKRSMYMFPKHIPGSAANDVGVIGGTFIEGATADTPNIQEFNLLIERVAEFYGL